MDRRTNLRYVHFIDLVMCIFECNDKNLHNSSIQRVDKKKEEKYYTYLINVILIPPITYVEISSSAITLESRLT